MHAMAVLRHCQFAVITTLPVQLQLEAPVRCAYDDLFEHRAQDALPGFGTSACVLPGALQVGSQREQLLALRLSQWRRIALAPRGQLLFESRHYSERFIPAPLQL